MNITSRHIQGPEGVWFGEHRISSWLFADDAVLLASSSHVLGLCAEMYEMAVSCSRFREGWKKRLVHWKHHDFQNDWDLVVVKVKKKKKTLVVRQKSWLLHLLSLPYGHKLYVMTKAQGLFFFFFAAEMSFSPRGGWELLELGNLLLCVCSNT